jgi:hypothetical protein
MEASICEKRKNKARNTCECINHYHEYNTVSRHNKYLVFDDKKANEHHGDKETGTAATSTFASENTYLRSNS